MLINIKTIISIFKYLVSLGYPVHTGFMAHTRQTEIYSYLDQSLELNLIRNKKPPYKKFLPQWMDHWYHHVNTSIYHAILMPQMSMIVYFA